MTILAPRNNLVQRLSTGGTRFRSLNLGSKNCPGLFSDHRCDGGASTAHFPA